MQDQNMVLKTETLWEERVRDAGLRENEGGTSNAGWSDPFPHLCSHGCSAGDGGEMAPEGRPAEAKAFSSHFGRQSVPLHDRHPFEILPSRLFTPRCGARATEASLRPGGPASCSCTVCAGTQHRPCRHGGISARLWERALLSCCLTPP